MQSKILAFLEKITCLPKSTQSILGAAKFSQKKIFVDPFDVKQIEFRWLTKNLYFTSPETIKLKFLSFILGESTNNRLRIACREKKQLVYGIYSCVVEYYSHQYFHISTNVSKENLPEVIKTIKNEIGRLKEELLTKNDLTNLIKEMSRILVVGNDIQGNINDYIVDDIFQKEKMLPDDLCKYYEALTAEDLREMARKVFVPENYMFCAHGPIEKNELQKMIKDAL